MITSCLYYTIYTQVTGTGHIRNKIFSQKNVNGVKKGKNAHQNVEQTPWF